jgi:AraC family transcriptional regulator of adaptative response/methylated-DNA-[protein]-cysteine methyltransferase
MMDDFSMNLKKPTKHHRLVARVVKLIDAFEDEGQPTLAYLAERLSVSPFHLQRVFKREMGVSPRQYAEQRRLGSLKEELRNGRSVTTALYEAGFGGSSRLYETSNRKLGMTPASYGRGGRGAHIFYAVGTCTLGVVLAAITEIGLCRVCFGDTAADVEKELAEEFPAATLERADKDMSELLAILGALIDTGKRNFSGLGLDIQITAFQAKVWSALILIPEGETRSYGDIATELGMPKAARAVGRACGSNPVGIVIPCHRAVGADGKITGYRWGLDRKKALLDAEQRRSK